MRAFVIILGLVAILAAVEPLPMQRSIQLDARSTVKETPVEPEHESDSGELIGAKKVRRVIAVDHGDHPVDEEQERQEKRLFSPHHHIVISGVGGGERNDRIKRDLFTALLRHKGQYKFGIEGGEDGDDGDDTDDSSEQ